jgi:cysteine-rich secretory family protein
MDEDFPPIRAHRHHPYAPLVFTTAFMCSLLSAVATAPIAHADPLDGVRGAVNGARAQSTCSALTYNGDLEAAAQEIARQPSDAYIHIDPHGYQGETSGNLVRDDPTAKATSELVEQERIPIHDCANKDFGVGMFRDAGADQSIVTVVLGRPAPPPAPPVQAPAPPKDTRQAATVVGGDADVWDIAHNDVPDPATGVRGAKIGTVKNGSTIVLDRPCTNGWCHVISYQIPGDDGFVEQSHVQIS